LRLIKKNGIKAKESLFIDDTIANIEAAAKLGFNTIHLKNPAKLGYILGNAGII